MFTQLGMYLLGLYFKAVNLETIMQMQFALSLPRNTSDTQRIKYQQTNHLAFKDPCLKPYLQDESQELIRIRIAESAGLQTQIDQ